MPHDDHDHDRIADEIESGRMSYADAAILVFRRICAVSGRQGLTVGSGDVSAPIVLDLLAQPEIGGAHLFGLGRRQQDQLGALDRDPFGDATIEVHRAGLGRDGGVRIDQTLADDASAVAYMVLTVPVNDLAPIEGASGRLQSDKPVLLVDTQGAAGAAGKGWRTAIASVLSGYGYRTVGAFGRPVPDDDDSNRPGHVWAFPPDWAETGPALVALAVAKAAADADAVARPV